MKLYNRNGFYGLIGSILYSSERPSRSHHPSSSKTMKTIFVYIAATAIAMNVAGNMAANTTEGLKAAQAARTEKLCAVNPLYC